MEYINKNNIKTLKALKKHLENEFLDTWPSVIKEHKQAIINAVSNSIDSLSVVVAHGGVKTMIDQIAAAQKNDLFAGTDLDLTSPYSKFMRA